MSTKSPDPSTLPSPAAILVDGAEFRPGSVVRLKSSGAHMTVGQLVAHPDTPSASCFHHASDGSIHMAVVPLRALVLLADGATTPNPPWSMLKKGDEFLMRCVVLRPLDSDEEVAFESADGDVSGYLTREAYEACQPR